MADYEAPTVTELGTVADFTRGQGIRGNADHYHVQVGPFDFVLEWGHS